jgi:hypothetical protein
LAFEVAAQDSQEGCGGWAEGEGDEQGAFFAWFRVFHPEGFEAFDDFRLHVFAEAGFADGLGANGDRDLFGLAAFAEGFVGCGCGWFCVCGWRLLVGSRRHLVCNLIF